MNNHHTHTFRCRHARGDVEDYVRHALKAEMAEIGFSDHVALPDDRWADMRMYYHQLPDYLFAIAEARRAHGNSIRIFSGFEAEWIPEYASLYREEYLGRLGMDYLAGGIHYYRFRGGWADSFDLRSPAMLAAFAAHTQEALASGLFAFLAHPDVFCYSWLPWDANAEACARDILQAAEETGIPLEINGYGLRKPKIRVPGGSVPGEKRRPYPHTEFWRLAAGYRVRVIVNSDAHDPADIASNLEEGRALAASFGLRVIDSLDPPAVHH